MSGARAGAWLLMVLALGLPRGLQAQSASECASRVDGLLIGAGAEAREDSWRGFLVSGEARSLPLRFERAGCVGVLAAVASGVGALRLELVTLEGDPLVEREITSRSGYLRFCGAPGLSLVAIVRVLRGQGEVRLSSYDAAPRRLPVAVSPCLGLAEGVTTGEISVGRAPEPPSASDQQRAARRFGERFGYVPIWSRALTQAEPSPPPLQVEAGECFALQLAASQPMRALWLRVEGTGERPWSRSARGRDVAELWLSFCADESGPAQLRASDG
ncbi:MAG: hypothetical protein GXP55_11520, partial [Deltaproteobacteria bacterium]|nr:hypothetical protein [Deltaproteobacteria bacterium]